MTDICIVGGGVIGLLTAYQLAEEGLEVQLFEQQQVGREASWAGGGIVSPLYPWRYSPEITALAQWSQGFYPILAQRLLASAGVDPEVRVSGLYWLDLDDEPEARKWARQQQMPLDNVPIEQVEAAVPALGKGFSRALYSSTVANVRNPRLLRALRATLMQMPNVKLREHSAVERFIVEHSRVVGVHAGSELVKAERTIVAAGAWSGSLLATLGLNLPVVPVRGQMILYKQAEDFLESMVMAQGRYAVPRRDGHILIGSTLEHVGFDKSTTDDALHSLRSAAIKLLPALESAPVVAHWAGLRPGSPDGVPYIGEVAQYPGLWLNCGHHRNGLVLAPGSCRLLADMIMGQTPIIDPTPYAPSVRLG